MNRVDSKSSQNDPNTKFLTFQPRNHSRQYNKSKSSKKNHINKNLLSPCQPLGEKLLKAVMQKNQRKITNINKREKTQQSILQSSMILDSSRCFNHPDKKGQYFLQNHPNKKFCLKCNLTLNGGNSSTFITKQSNFFINLLEHLKKQTLDKFKQQLSRIKQQIETNRQILHTSIQNSQYNFSMHSNYINDSFHTLRQQLQEKRREMLNNLIIAQQNVKKQFQDNMKKLKKMGKSIERYELDIKKFYDQIIEELPKSQFDHIMEEYEQKINRNFRSKLKSILIQDGICVYIPNVEMKAIIQKSNVQFYQPVISERSCMKQTNLSFSQKEQGNFQQKRNGSNSLDSKMNDLVSNVCLDKKPAEIKLLQKRRQPDLNLFEKRTANFLSPNREINRNKLLIEDKENINLQNFTHDYLNHKNQVLNKFTFKS